MQFEILNIDEYNKFLEKHPLNNFLQSSLMDEVSKMKNQKVYYVGIKKSNKVLCAARIIAINSRFGKKYFYSPRGLIVDYNNFDLLKTFTNELKKFIKSKGGFELIIDPNVLYKERDINGALIENGFDNNKVIDNLRKLGYKHLGFTKGNDISRQVRWQFAMNIENKTEEEVFSDFKPNTRNLISKALRIGVKIEELKYEDLYKFKKITQETSERIGFNDKPLQYYQEMYKSFVPEKKAKFLLATLDLAEYLKSIENDREILSLKLSNLEKGENHIKKSKKNNLIEEISNLQKRIFKIKEIINEDGEKINLSAAMFIIYGNEVTYAFSGNIDKYMMFNGAYLIQWHMIKYAIEQKIKRYNFSGISGNFDKNDVEYGVYEFKKGFNGIVEEYIGEFVLPISKFYYINKFTHKLKK